MEKTYKERIDTKKCTWKNCNKVAKHQEPGSLIALCDKHNEELENSFKFLF